MRIVFCGTNDLAGVLALNALRPIFEGHEAMLLLSNEATPRSDAPELKEFSYFMSELPSQRIFPLIERRDKPSEGALLTATEIAKRHGIPTRMVTRGISESVVQDVIDFVPDLILSMRFTAIFKEPLLSLPRWGIYNIHSGALPGYGGMMTTLRVVSNGEEMTGCTLHRVDAGIDTGPIVGVRYLGIRPDKSLLWHICHLYPLCVPLFEEVLACIGRGEEVETTAQDSKQRRYYGAPGRDEIDEFISRGNHFVTLPDYLELLGRFV
jgi:methionyl-tRNA formyltransferase